MSNSFPIQKKWLDDVKDTMKPEEFAELNYRINIYALYGEEVALTDNRYVQGYFNSIKSQIDNMNKKYKKVGRPGIFTEEEQEIIRKMAGEGYNAPTIAKLNGWDEKKKKAIYEQPGWKNRGEYSENSSEKEKFPEKVQIGAFKF